MFRTWDGFLKNPSDHADDQAMEDGATNKRRSAVPPRSGGGNRRAVSVRLLLVALALVPLVGTLWFATRQATQTSHARDEAAYVTNGVNEHADVIALRSAVLDERNWTLVALGIAELGIPNDLVVDYTGIDPETELTNARAAVDSHTSLQTMPDIADAIAEVRAQPGIVGDAAVTYLAIDHEVALRGDLMLRELMTKAGDIEGAGDLVEALNVLDGATRARQAIGMQLTTYFAVQFASANGPNDDLRLLAGQQATYGAAIDDLVASAHPGSATAIALEHIQSSPAVQTFAVEIDTLVSTAMTDGLRQIDMSLAAVFANVDEIAAAFRNGAESASIHLSLVDAATADAALASHELTDTTSAAAARAGWTFVALAIASMAFALALSRFFMLPLSRLAHRARQLRDGRHDFTTGMRGPREVRDVAAAIEEAAAHLALVERQANALAEGDLQHPALSESAPGNLGSSLQVAVRTLADSLDERDKFRRRLAHEAAHDGLTALPNRGSSLAQLQRGVARTRRHSEALAVFFVDLDGFKRINDGHGHLIGDRVLRAVAQRLVTSVREGDHVGRLGGDEFLIVAEPVGGVEEALELARRVRSAVSEPVRLNGTWFRVDASIGVAYADHTSDLSADELLRDADLAVYKAKNLGRGRIELCDSELKNELQRLDDLETALKRAVIDDEFTLHYQPIVDPITGELNAVEALLRWGQPGGSIVPPGDFIAFAERSDLIIDIDNWVIANAAKQMSAWSNDEMLRDVSVSINISGRHFESEHIVANILGPLEQHGIDPSRLIIEVTEGALLGPLDRASAKLRTLRAAGLRIAIDDFGTGYTSLAYLRALPIDVIKIDRTFIADETAAPLVKLIIDIGHLIGARITAEGIETPEQAMFLSSLGCDSVQGYFYGHPVAPHELTARASAVAISQP